MRSMNRIVKNMKQEQDVPKAVWDKYIHTLETLPERTAKAKRNNRKGVAAAAAAGMLIIGGFVCHANPTLAAKIPIIGAIFKQIENTTTYSGNYSEKAVILAADDANEEYIAEDAGVKVSASEVVYDGVSVFLTMKIEVEDGNLSSIPTHYTNDDGTKTAVSMYLWGTYEVPDIISPQALTEEAFYLEGKVVDDHTFVGMLKMDIKKENISNAELELKISGIGYDDIAMLDAKDISASHKIEGAWELAIPVDSGLEQTKTFTFDTKGEDYKLEKITISPYQMVTDISVPYTEKEITREEYEAAMKTKTDNTEDFGISYEEYIEMKGKSYAESYTVVYNQDGEPLTPRSADRSGESVFVIKGEKISKVQVLVFRDQESWMNHSHSTLTEDAIAAAADYKVIVVE